MPQKKKTLIIIDANSLIHRAFHALPPLSTPKGEMVNAVYGFLLIFFKAIKEFHPDYIAACFDMPGPLKREKMFADYKANRVAAPDELYSQIPLVKEALEAFGVPSYEKQGFEADDIIGTVAKKVPQRQVYPPVETIIISGDMDMLQLVNGQTKVYTMRKSIQDVVLYDKKAVEKRFDGLGPEQMADYKGLRGDPSDNIPGVTGIGEKTAIQLLQDFRSLDELYKALEEGKTGEKIKPRIVKLLEDYKEQAFLSRDLATIDLAVPIDFNLTDISWKGFDTKKVESMLQGFQFRTLLSKLPELEGKKRKQASLLEEGDEPRNEEDVNQEMLQKIEGLYEDKVFSKEIYELEKKLVPVMRSMEQVGIKIDKKYFSQLAKQATKEIAALEKKIHTFASKTFNIKSPQQLSEILFDVLGLPRKGLRKTPGGAISTASEELEKLEGEHRIVKEVLKYRELQKMYSTYIKPLPELADTNDRLHTHFDQLGAATGRISSSNPNLQNIPVQGEWGTNIRKGFVAEKGFVLVSFDYSQMELRLAAHIAKDEKLRQFFKEGADIHAMTAAEVFGVAPDKVTKDMRFRAKALNFGILYGMGARGFARSAEIPFEEAISFIEQYFMRFPKIQEYIEETKEFARQHGYTETIFGRKRYIPEINSTTGQLQAAAERVAINHPIQGSAADIVKMAMVNIAEKDICSEKECRMLLQIHDELLFEISPARIKEVAPKIIEIMEGVYNLDVLLKTDVKQGKSWGELK